ncbi:MAG: hypothetical protein NTZ32_00970 [Planctomycetales bacterium]|nr:hypothetical protein [Planctomycetales bacterium]
MSRPESEISVADLERILDARKSQAQNLVKRRDALHKELAEIQEQLQGIVGTEVTIKKSGAKRGRPPGSGKRGPGRPRGSKDRGARPKNELSLRDVISELLSKSKKGLTLEELTPKVVEAGYKSNSSNFSNMIYQNIYNSEGIVKDPETGCYSLVQE